MSQEELRDRLCAVLLDKVSRDAHPSTTMLDHLEQASTGKLREAYISALIDRVQNDPLPSPDLLNRITFLLRH